MVLDGSEAAVTASHHSPLRLQPPLVSFIALLGRTVIRPHYGPVSDA